MGLPESPVTLTAEQIAALNRCLYTMRHDVNNNLSVMAAAAELVRSKPELAGRMMVALLEQPARIAGAIKTFSAEFERVFGITRS